MRIKSQVCSRRLQGDAALVGPSSGYETRFFLPSSLRLPRATSTPLWRPGALIRSASTTADLPPQLKVLGQKELSLAVEGFLPAPRDLLDTLASCRGLRGAYRTCLRRQREADLAAAVQAQFQRWCEQQTQPPESP